MGDPTTIALNLTFFGTLGLAFLMFLGLFLLVVLTLMLAGAGRLLALTVMALFGRLPKHETIPLVRLTGEAGNAAEPSPSTPDGDAPAASAPPARRSAAALGTRVSAALGTRVSAAVATLTKPRDWRKAVRTGRTALKPSELKPRLQNAVKHHPMVTAAHKEPPVLAEDWAAAVAAADARAIARARAAVPEIKVTVRDLPGPSVPAAKVEAVAPLVESALHQDKAARDHGGEGPSRGTARSFTKPPAPPPLSILDTGSLVSLSGPAQVLKAQLPADRS